MSFINKYKQHIVVVGIIAVAIVLYFTSPVLTTQASELNEVVIGQVVASAGVLA